MYVLFNFTTPDRRPVINRTGWAWKKLDLTKLNNFVREASIPPVDRAVDMADLCSAVLVDACNSCMPEETYKWGKKPCHWWTLEISGLRKICMQARRALRRARHRREDCQQRLEEYREHRRKLKVAIRQSKENSWRQLCNQVEVDPWGLPYKLVTKKLVGRRPITGLTIPGRLDLIVDTLFPSHQEPSWVGTELPEEVPQITCEDLISVGSSLPTNKAPGPDGILDMWNVRRKRR